MSTYIIVLSLLVGFTTGLVAAVVGLGGGLIMLPFLQKILGLDPLLAIGTTLMSVVFVSLSGGYAHFKAGNIDWSVAKTIGGYGILGMLLGSYAFDYFFSQHLDYLRFFLSVLFFLVAIRLLLDIREDLKKQDKKLIISKKSHYSKYLLPSFGLGVGLLTGILGLGGGFILMPFFIYYLKFSPEKAAGNSLVAIFCICLLGALIKYFQGYVDLSMALVLGLASIGGAHIGVYIAKRLNPIYFKLACLFLFLYMSYDYFLCF